MSSPALPGIFGAVEPVLNHYGYLAVAVLVMLEDFGIPVPGETVLIAASLFAGAGRLNVVLVGVIATLAAIAGDNIGFAIGHFGGRALALRWGKYVFLTAERLDKAEYFFDHHGGKIIVIARFVEGLRQANGIVAGITGMHWKRFFLFNAIGAALWVGVWVSLGYLAGNHITTIYTQITRYSLYVLIAGVVLIVGFIAWRLWRRRIRRAQQRQRAVETTGSKEAAGGKEDVGASEPTVTSGAAGTSQAGGRPQVGGTPESTGAQRGTGTPEAGGTPGNGLPAAPPDAAAPPDSATPPDAAPTPDPAPDAAPDPAPDPAPTPDAAATSDPAWAPDPAGREVGERPANDR